MKSLLDTTALQTSSLMTMRMTPIERSLGRFMRAPDGHEGGEGDAGNGGEGDAGQGGSGDAGAGDDGTSVLGGVGDEADAGAGDGGESGEAAGGDDDGAKGEGGEAAAAEVPETYELKVTQTVKDDDGNDVEQAVEIDPQLVEAAAPVLKDLGMTNEQANKLAPLAIKVQERMLQVQADEFDAVKSTWAKQGKEDPEIGGKHYSESLTLAAKAFDHLGIPKEHAFRQLLDQSGLGNHPEMLRVFRKVGAMIKEDDKLEGGDRNPQGKKDRLQALYPQDVPEAQKQS